MYMMFPEVKTERQIGAAYTMHKSQAKELILHIARQDARNFVPLRAPVSLGQNRLFFTFNSGYWLQDCWDFKF